MPQTRFILVGGFLGAGKTTAILQLAEFFKRDGKRAAVITNDQSVNLVDTARVRVASLPVREITGGCFCCRFDSLVDASSALAQESSPNVLIAEPVGSCTDLQATVSYPLRKLHGQKYDLAPYSVLVDPARCAEALGIGGKKSAFTDKVNYIYIKQLEEADLLVINKTDLLDEKNRRELKEVLQKHFPATAVLEISCKTGEGLEAWFGALCSAGIGKRPAMEVDYDTYADGEARLGWLNATLNIAADKPLESDALLQQFASNLKKRLSSAGEEIAHLKMTLASADQPGFGSISLTDSHGLPQSTSEARNTFQNATLTINLRAEADPARLRQAVCEEVSSSLPSETRVAEIHAFRPGRPTPTHRMS